MDVQKADMYIATNGKCFDGFMIPQIHEMLLQADDSKFLQLQGADLKDPTTMLIISFFGGSLGIDRFMLGDTGTGLGKLLTCGGLGIWALVDLFLIMGRTREVNFNKFQKTLYM